jgi:hypothetical protein
MARWREMGMEVVILQTGNIRRQGAEEHIHIPFWTETGAPLGRQCTRHFKINPMRRYLRKRLGFDPSSAPAPPPGSIEQWLGFTLDEKTRAKKSRVQYIVNKFPLLDMNYSRDNCSLWYQEHRLPEPPKSACVCCPFRRASEWIELRDQSPEEWTAAVEFDEANRDNPLALRGSTADELYVYRDEPVPLLEADLEFYAEKDKRQYGVQLPLFGCESGYCGT